MAGQDKTPDATGPEALSGMMRAYLEMQMAGLAPLRRIGEAWVEAFGDLGSELAEFMAERIQEDVKTQHEILNCTSADELREIQTRFVQRAIDRYTEETGKLVKLNQAALDRLQSGAGG